MNATPDVDVPEGNGSGVVWDTSGNIVTNYHGEQSAKPPRPPQSTRRRG